MGGDSDTLAPPHAPPHAPPLPLAARLHLASCSCHNSHISSFLKDKEPRGIIPLENLSIREVEEPRKPVSNSPPPISDLRLVVSPPQSVTLKKKKNTLCDVYSPELFRALQPEPQRSGDQSLQDGGRRAGGGGQPRGLQDIGANAGRERGVDQIHQVREIWFNR